MKPKKFEVKDRKEFLEVLKPLFDTLNKDLWTCIEKMDERMLHGIFSDTPLPSALAILLNEITEIYLEEPEGILN